MGVQERRERERAAVRTKILDAARELFVKEGYEAVTMRRVAERIEYSPTAIYLHFRDKEALLRALCDRDFGALARQFVRIARIADPIERLRASGLAYADYGLRHPNHYRLMFMTPHPGMRPEDSALERGNPSEDAYAFLRATIEECMERGLMRKELEDPEVLSQAVWAAVHGVVSLSITMGTDAWIPWRPPKAVLRLLIETLVQGLMRRGKESGGRERRRASHRSGARSAADLFVASVPRGVRGAKGGAEPSERSERGRAPELAPRRVE